MKRTLLALAAGALLLSGCSSNNSSDTAAPAPQGNADAATTTVAPTTPATPTSPRGNRLKTFGDRGGLGCVDDPCDMEFILGAPAPATNCSDLYAPENGDILAFPLRVETKAGADMSPFSGMWNPNSFSALLSSGVTVSGITSAAAYGCAESENTVPDTLSPASVYEAFVVLDVPTDATDLLYLPNVTSSAGGWEWKL